MPGSRQHRVPLIMRVRIVASTTTQLPFPEALGTLQCLHDKCRLPKSPVFIEAFPGKVTKWNPGTFGEETIGWQIIQFPGWAGEYESQIACDIARKCERSHDCSTS